MALLVVLVVVDTPTELAARETHRQLLQVKVTLAETDRDQRKLVAAVEVLAQPDKLPQAAHSREMVVRGLHPRLAAVASPMLAVVVAEPMLRAVHQRETVARAAVETGLQMILLQLPERLTQVARVVAVAIKLLAARAARAAPAS